MTFDPAKFRQDRKAAGLTQETVALRIGMRQTDISKYERGKQRPLGSTQVRLERGLHETN